MAWGTVELESEIREWLESLSTTHFARAAFYIQLLAHTADEEADDDRAH